MDGMMRGASSFAGEDGESGEENQEYGWGCGDVVLGIFCGGMGIGCGAVIILGIADDSISGWVVGLGLSGAVYVYPSYA